MRRFDYAAPTTINEACQLLTSNPNARPLAGGTDLLIQMKERGRPVPLLVSLRWVGELSSLKTNGQLEIGSMVTCGEVAWSDAVKRDWPGSSTAPTWSARSRSATRARSVGTCATPRPRPTSCQP